MTFDFSVKGEVEINMPGYVNMILNECGVMGEAVTPAADRLFDVRDWEPLGVDDAKWFHRQTARVLYLAKRTRPDCLTAVSFLSTRVTKSDTDDEGKLCRLLQYIRATKDRGIVLRPGVRGMQVRVYVDAAYGVHSD